MELPPRVMPAIITPFREDGEIDKDAHRHNLTALTARGVDGFVISGSTGQGPYLVPGERHLLVTIARDVLGADAHLLCGVQAESLGQAESQAAEAVAAGADALLVMTPTTLIRGNMERLAFFFATLAERSSIPVFLYSVPPTTGFQLPVEVAAELADHPNIVGLKDSGAEASRVPPLALAIDNGFLVLCGSSRVVHDFAAAGAYGAITASANYAYPLVVAARRDAAAQGRLTSLAAAVEGHGLPGTYAAAAAAGLRPGTLRPPLTELSGPDADRIAELVG